MECSIFRDLWLETAKFLPLLVERPPSSVTFQITCHSNPIEIFEKQPAALFIQIIKEHVPRVSQER